MVIEEIQPIEGVGQVKIGGQVWSAKTVETEVIPAGSIVEVVRVEGVKLFVKVKKNTAS